MPPLVHWVSSDESDSSSPPSKRLRSRSPDSSPIENIKVHIVQAKLDAATIDELYSLVEKFNDRIVDLKKTEQPRFELCGDISDTNIIITNIRMRKRLERHLDWNIARQKAIVTPQWLRDSARQGRPLACGDYAAINELRDETVKHCPPEPETLSESPPHTAGLSSSPILFEAPGVGISSKTKSNYKARYACSRFSPLVCPNQSLISQFAILRRSRELEGKAINALSYERAIATIKAYPYVITFQNFETEVTKLPYLGEKILSKIKEFISKGRIDESQKISASERFQCLSAFASIYGVGPATARQLYDIGLRTIEDMERYYDVPGGTDSSAIIESDAITTPNGRRVPRKTQLPNVSVKVALALRTDLNMTIPRAEVDEMHALVMAELAELRPGCVSTIVGGYRRGKPESNDVDIVISHPGLQTSGNQVKGLCARLVQRLFDRGVVTHVLHRSGFHAHDALRTVRNSLETALTVFILPQDNKCKRIHRRLDLIFAAPESYWTAVVGWTGSKMFERDLRLWAKEEKGMKFDSSGLTRRHDSKPFSPKTEKEVFDILGLEWIDPTLRNADF